MDGTPEMLFLLDVSNLDNLSTKENHKIGSHKLI